MNEPDKFLLDFQNGDIEIDALLLDVNFESLESGQLLYADPENSSNTPTGKHVWGFKILRTVKRIDPDFPVLMLTEITGQSVSFESGTYGADDFISKVEFISQGGASASDIQREYALTNLLKRIVKAKQVREQRAMYDHAHRTLADKFALQYDEVERKKCATLAYYHYESELIKKILDNLLEHLQDDGQRLKVLDIGCGTGRIEELVATHANRGKIEVVGVDFSAGMLKEAQKKLKKLNGKCDFKFGSRCEPNDDGKLHVSLFRAPAEHLKFLEFSYPKGFDLIIAGFGLLSYVNYNRIIPPSPQKPSTEGLYPLLKKGGKFLFSVYNEDSIVYSRIAKLDYLDENLPIAALMDRTDGRLRVDKYCFNCEAFTTSRIARFLMQGGFLVDSEENIFTFPTLHLLLKNTEIDETKGFKPYNKLPPGKFNSSLYALDLDASKVLPNLGHYIVGVARKPETLENKDDI